MIGRVRLVGIWLNFVWINSCLMGVSTTRESWENFPTGFWPSKFRYWGISPVKGQRVHGVCINRWGKLTNFSSGVFTLSKLMALPLGDLCDQRSRGIISLWRASYTSGSTGSFATILTPFDSANAISSTVSKLVTLGDLCDLQRPRVFSMATIYYAIIPTTLDLLGRAQPATISTPFDSA